jgi:hypothetical protein
MRRTLISLLILAALALGLNRPASAQDEFCEHPRNLTFNCSMDTFVNRSSGGSIREIAEGWTEWVELGNPAFDRGEDSPVPPSQRIWSDGGTWTVGMYQQVRNLTPGATYVAGLVWAPYTSNLGNVDNFMMRQIGLDPTGGTDPRAATVQWGPETWPFSRMTLLETRAVAAGSTMTFFIRVHNSRPQGQNQLFLDGAWMHQDESAPVAQPTATPAPPAQPTPEPTPPAVPVQPRGDGPDWAIPNGHFYTQAASGQGGFGVVDDGQARFWSEFQRLGGLQTIGYPISQRFTHDGFVTQAFQKLVLQWRPEVNQAWPVNVFDDLSRAGHDTTLLERRQTPRPLAGDFDAPGASWQQVVANRQALLNDYPALRQRYFSASDPLAVFGLPTSRVEDMGNHYAIRTQRAVFQQWKEAVPWAAAGQVTIANGGDIAKELGWLPAAAIQPEAVR